MVVPLSSPSPQITPEHNLTSTAMLALSSLSLSFQPTPWAHRPFIGRTAAVSMESLNNYVLDGPLVPLGNQVRRPRATSSSEDGSALSRWRGAMFPYRCSSS